MSTLQKINKLLGTDYVYWGHVSMHKYLSEDFIREFKGKVDWTYISAYQHLSEDFIREFKDRVDWENISVHQHLSEDFIREFKDRVDWNFISIYQHLSEDFIREFKDRVDWACISGQQHLSEDFIREFNDKMSTESINDSWHYKDMKFKKKAVMDTGLYECYDDYFIAYKGIRSDRWSKFNFQYKYEKGGVYESWCDSSSDENSFGLSAWTEEKARDYCDELVVRVKIRYEDVGRVVHEGGKIRCFKFEVLD